MGHSIVDPTSYPGYFYILYSVELHSSRKVLDDYGVPITIAWNQGPAPPASAHWLPASQCTTAWEGLRSLVQVENWIPSLWITMITIVPNLLKGRWIRPLTSWRTSLAMDSTARSLLYFMLLHGSLFCWWTTLLGCEQMSSSCINQLHFEGTNLTNVVHAPCSQQHVQWMY